MTFEKIDLTPKFKDDYFKLNNLLKESKEEKVENNPEQDSNSNNNTEDTPTVETKETATIEDIIYPMYLPENTYLTSQEKIDTKSGERLILTFEGDNPFILVEETISPTDSNVIIPTNGDLEFLTDVIGIVNERSINWVSNNIEYYLASEVLETSELIEIAQSISVLPVSK